MLIGEYIGLSFAGFSLCIFVAFAFIILILSNKDKQTTQIEEIQLLKNSLWRFIS